MQSSYAALTGYAAPTEAAPPIQSSSLAAVGLFCLIGLAISVIVISSIPAEDFGWIVAHLE
jgi:hypothetical protein